MASRRSYYHVSVLRCPHALLLMVRGSITWKSSLICFEEISSSWRPSTLCTIIWWALGHILDPSLKRPLILMSVKRSMMMMFHDMMIPLFRLKADPCTPSVPLLNHMTIETLFLKVLLPFLRSVLPLWNVWAFPVKCVARIISLVTSPPISLWGSHPRCLVVISLSL